MKIRFYVSNMYFLILLSLVFTSCGKDTETTTCKSLQSTIWTDITDANFRAQMPVIGSGSYVFYTSSGDCYYDSTMSGSEESGSFSLTYNRHTGSIGAATCQEVDGNYTYTHTCNSLTVCDSLNDCDSFR